MRVYVYPIGFVPLLREYLFGGRRLRPAPVHVRSDLVAQSGKALLDLTCALERFFDVGKNIRLTNVLGEV